MVNHPNRSTRTNIFEIMNNDGTGRDDWHVEVNGAAHSAVFGPFRSKRAAERVAAEKRQQPYWSTGEGHY